MRTGRFIITLCAAAVLVTLAGCKTTFQVTLPVDELKQYGSDISYVNITTEAKRPDERRLPPGIWPAWRLREDEVLRGDTIQLTARIKEAYTLTSISVVDGGGKNITLYGDNTATQEGPTSTYTKTFIMPRSDVTVQVKLKAPEPLTRDVFMKIDGTNDEDGVPLSASIRFYIINNLKWDLAPDQDIDENFSYGLDGRLIRKETKNEGSIPLPQFTPGKIRLDTPRIMNADGTVTVAVDFGGGEPDQVLYFTSAAPAGENNDDKKRVFALDVNRMKSSTASDGGKTTEIRYGGKKYLISAEKPPMLFIKYDDITETNSTSKALAGRRPPGW